MADLEYRVSIDTRTGIASLKKLNKQLNKTEKAAKKTDKGFSELKKGLTGLKASFAGLLAAGGITAVVKSSLDFADAIGKAADVAGVSTRAIQELRYTFDQFGVTQKETDDSLRRLSRRLGEFVKSGGGPAKAAFDQLGLSAKIMSGEISGTEQVFNNVVHQLGQIEDATVRSAFAAQLFGDDAGPKLATALGKGSHAILDLRNKANELGLVIDDKLIRNSEAANDKLSTLAQVIRVQVISAVVEAAPQIQAMVQAIIDNRDQIKSTVEALVDFARLLGTVGGAAVNFAQDLGIISRSVDQQIAKVKEALEGSAFDRVKFFGPKGVIEYYSDEELRAELARLEKIKAGMANTAATAAAAQKERIDAQLKTMGVDTDLKPVDFKAQFGIDKTKASIDELTAAYLPLKQAQTDYAALVEKINAIETNENFTLEERNAILAKAKAEYEDHIRELTGVNKAREEAARKAEELKRAEEKLNEEVKQTVNEYLPLKALTKDLKTDQIRLNAALKQGLITQQEHAKAMKELNKRYKDFFKQQRSESREWSDGWARALDEYVENATNAAQQAESVFRTATQGMEDAIVGFAKTGKFEWKQFLSSIVDDLLRSQARQLVANIFGGLSGGNSGFAGFFANGGTIPAGQFGIVGERGPELVTGPAEVTPLTGGGNVTYNINAVDALSFKQLVARDPQFMYAITEEGRRGLPSRR